MERRHTGKRTRHGRRTSGVRRISDFAGPEEIAANCDGPTKRAVPLRTSKAVAMNVQRQQPPANLFNACGSELGLLCRRNDNA
jgi:hypothetical protein